MAATICPTITVDNAHDYSEQMEKIESFATRIHIDVADGIFAPRKLIELDQIWWRGNRTIDVHMMYQRPIEHLDMLLTLSPRLIIVHAEADGNFIDFAKQLRRHGIEVGIALLPQTAVEEVKPALEQIDHVLIFSGNLGYQGGSEADFSLLEKAKTLRQLKPTVEIGWDGGVNDQNAKRLAEAGVDVLNAGGYIQNASQPEGAYAKLASVIK